MSKLFRYFFVVQTPTQRFDDEGGTLLPNDAAALACARQILADLKSDEGHDHRGWSMLVQDAEGRAVCTIPF